MLTGYSPWGREESDTVEVTEHMHADHAAIGICIYVSLLILDYLLRMNSQI